MNPEIENLVNAGKLAAPVGERLSALEPGAICVHKSWGVGKIAEWDLIGGQLVIDFEDKPGHRMKLEFAAKSLEAVNESHILARRFADPEAISQLAIDSPEEVVKSTLESYGGTMFLDAFDDVIKGKIVPEGKYKSWWDAAKRKLRSDRRFVVPSKRTEPLELRDADISAADAMVGDFKDARDLKSKVKAGAQILKELDAFEAPEIELLPVVEEINDTIGKASKMNPAQVVELVLAREALFAHSEALKAEKPAAPSGGEAEEGEEGKEVAPDEGVTLVSILRQEESRLQGLLSSLPVAAQRKLLEAFPDAFGDEWINQALDQFNKAGPRGVGELAKFILGSGRESELEAFLKTGIQHRSLGADVLVWLCRERKGFGSRLFNPNFAPCLIQTLERDYYDEEASRNNRLHDAILNDQALIPDLMALCDVHQAKSFARRLMASPVFEELNRRSLLARIVKSHQEVADLVSGDDNQDDDGDRLIVSWESLEERKKAFDKIVKTDIPENKKEIQIAREYGDLRENFEYKAAKEKQAVLMRMQSEMEKELASARGTDFSEAPTDVVSIGTTVEITDSASGETERFNILGAWDTDLDRGIISYLSETGAALLGATPGEEVELPTESGTSRRVRVSSIERWNKGTEQPVSI